MKRITWTLLSALLFASITHARGEVEPGPGVLKGEFVYAGETAGHPLAGKCTAPGGRALSGIATDILVGLAGKLTESLIDAAAARTQPEATTLEVVVPLDGFYSPKEIAVDAGCLVFHNGTASDASDASVKAVFQVLVSKDRKAFRFDVIEWQYKRFLKPEPSRSAQKKDVRDFVMKIEFLAPGSEGVGTRRVFVEYPQFGVTQASIAGAFSANQKLPWFSAPPPPEKMEGLSLPLNIRITLIETTKPNQFALWLQQVAKDKKGDISTAVQNAVRESLDPNYAATQSAQAADAAGTAYAAYKTAWDALAALHAAKPVLPPNPTPAQQAVYNAAVKTFEANVAVNERLTEAKRIAAKMAFDAADLKWPGDLPKPVD